ncbi:hypothetical protein TrST_g14365 [Triparma strigata]|uniref:Protein kinase domain-containing protein n=1 Tax=Triparma strigata TaxID=1606541 RepID=A0A9W7B287_9STRA|nr:hypothetical protein TrST_g14365 [Triparma strigata]
MSGLAAALEKSKSKDAVDAGAVTGVTVGGGEGLGGKKWEGHYKTFLRRFSKSKRSSSSDDEDDEDENNEENKNKQTKADKRKFLPLRIRRKNSKSSSGSSGDGEGEDEETAWGGLGPKPVKKGGFVTRIENFLTRPAGNASSRRSNSAASDDLDFSRHQSSSVNSFDEMGVLAQRLKEVEHVEKEVAGVVVAGVGQDEEVEEVDIFAGWSQQSLDNDDNDDVKPPVPPISPPLIASTASAIQNVSVVDFNNGSEDSDSNSDSSSDFDESQLKKLEEDLITPKSGHLYSKSGSTEGGVEVNLSGVNVAGEGKVRGGTLFEALFAGSKEDGGEKGLEGGAPSEIQNAMLFQESENLDNTRRTSNNSAPTSPLSIRTTTPTSPMSVPPPSKDMRTAFTEFHNSSKFAQDSTSAFLGEESSVHQSNKFGLYFGAGSLSSPVSNSSRSGSSNSLAGKEHFFGSNSNTNSHAGLGHSTSYTSFSSSLQSLDEDYPTLLNSSTNSYSLLLALEDTDSWTAPLKNSATSPTRGKVTSSSRTHNFIIPAVISRCGANCPMVFKMVQKGKDVVAEGGGVKQGGGGDGGGGGDDEYGFYTGEESGMTTSTAVAPLMSSNFSGFEVLSLGHVYISQINNINCGIKTPVKNNMQSRFLNVYGNYLYEYTQYTSASGNSNDVMPLGFACLENSKVVHIDDVSFNLSFYSRPHTSSEVVTIFVKCGDAGRKEWIAKCIEKAGRLAMKDLWVIDDGGDGVLGEGRFAHVRKTRRIGEEDKQENMVAVKVIDKDEFWKRVDEGRERKDTLVRELTIQTALTYSMCHHPSYFPGVFVKLLGVFETFKHLVIEMEFVESETSDMFQLLQLRSTLSELEAADYVYNILLAVRGMQSVGIAHRDIKLANLMITNGGGGWEEGGEEEEGGAVFLKLGDYGMANFIGKDGLLLGRCGTPGYVAPEILRAGKNVGYGNNVDVFSTGVVMYTVLCGYEPFYGESEKELVECNKRAKVHFPEEDWGDIGEEPKRLIKRMLDSNPDTRITADEALRSKWFQECELPEAVFGGDEGEKCIVS